MNRAKRVAMTDAGPIVAVDRHGLYPRDDRFAWRDLRHTLARRVVMVVVELRTASGPRDNADGMSVCSCKYVSCVGSGSAA